jgi:hypothetical protein
MGGSHLGRDWRVEILRRKGPVPQLRRIIHAPCPDLIFLSWCVCRLPRRPVSGRSKRPTTNAAPRATASWSSLGALTQRHSWRRASACQIMMALQNFRRAQSDRRRYTSGLPLLVACRILVGLGCPLERAASETQRTRACPLGGVTTTAPTTTGCRWGSKRNGTGSASSI